MSALPNTVSQISVRRLVNMVDKLGDINAQIAKLQDEADEMKKALKTSGYTDVVGSRYRAVISTSTRHLLDREMVATFLSPEHMDMCTKDSTSTKLEIKGL
jgi:hypothetical protein